MDVNYSTSVPVVQVMTNRIVVYQEYYRSSSSRKVSQSSLANLNKNRFQGVMSPQAQKRCRNIIDTWIATKKYLPTKSNHKKMQPKVNINFVTLTLSATQLHSDKTIKRELLNHFLITAQRLWGVKNYVWKAETQGNGNLHFHIIIDKYIDKTKLRDKWNDIQQKLGYIDAFELIYGHRCPPSTRIHDLRDVHHTAQYMIKYMTKNEGERFDSGKCWGCSDGLHAIKPAIIGCTGEVIEAIESMKREKGFRFKQMDYAAILFGQVVEYMRVSRPKMFKEYQEWLAIMVALINGEVVESKQDNNRQASQQQQQPELTFAKPDYGKQLKLL